MTTPSPFRFAAVLVALTLSGVVRADPAPAPAPVKPAAVAPLDAHTVEKRSAPALKAVKLDDPAKLAVVRAAVDAHLQAVHAWHVQNDARLSQLWSDWAAARNTDKVGGKTAELGRAIDAAYAELQPQLDAFTAALAKVLTPEQVEGVKNGLTKSPGLPRTYGAYLKMIPNLTDAQKTVIREKFTLARDQSLNTETDKEKANLFKKQKDVVEAYVVAEGYDYKALYKAYASGVNGATGK